MNVRIATTGSEIIFRKLRIAAFEGQTRDAFREGFEANVAGVEADFAGSFSVVATVRLESLGSTGETGETDMATSTRASRTGTSPAPTRWAWRYVGSGRVDASVTQAGARLLLQLVQLKTKEEPSVELVESDVILGMIDFLKVEGFGKYGGKIITKVLPFLQGTWLVNYPTKLIANFFIKEMVEGREMQETIKEIIKLGRGHVDLETYGGLVDEERKTELAVPVDENSLVPPGGAPPVSNSISSSTSSLSSYPSSTTSSLVEKLPSSPKSTSFRLHAHLIGPTLLTAFRLPDFSPILYPPGGHRAALQSLNLLTDEFKLELSENELSKISFERASLAFDPPSSVGPEGGLGGGELVITVQSFQVVLLSHFKIHANTSSIVSWTTGLKKIGEKGSSSTIVTSRSLQLRFHLEPTPPTQDDQHTSSPYQLTSSSISPFTTITPSFKLDTPALALGTELLNLVTSQLDQLIAKAASVIVQKFMKEDMRRRLQELIDGAAEKLREVGIELPSEFRGSV